MTERLYKFMNMDVFKSFLEIPRLRVTPSWEQNDPFEFFNGESTNCTDMRNLHGAISLCSNLYSAPMWAHYADNHRGVVVEILVNKKNPWSIFSKSYMPPEDSDFGFYEVIYRNLPYNFSHATEKYIVKDRSWSYEHEQRFIVPFTYINGLITTKTSINKIEEITGRRYKWRQERDDSEFYETDQTLVSDLVNIDPNLLLRIFLESRNNNTMFFLNLNTGIPGSSTGCLGKIYAGYKTDTDELREIINKSHSYASNIYQSITSNNYQNIEKIHWNPEHQKISLKGI
ncbi:DUF2971 domain-containing protein [Thalassolituus sp. C2-1]|uniref:DUF2971 domain-containing protein n=1 Tax=Venatorbacter sp. C2-1 TaxID=2597518 RepID=UPI001195D5CF|nr:DUF2971 domain-containing protein [Thalassolituus sp. C2-1]TVV44388.1 DUF2971 domain-containing protein [Thalassolituus sp. C2-1]